MANREECPVCKEYASDIYTAFQKGDDCPRCGISYNSVISFLEVEQKKKQYQSNKIEKELIEENELMQKELILKRDRYMKMRHTIFSMFFKMQEIVKELDEKSIQSMKNWDYGCDETDK